MSGTEFVFLIFNLKNRYDAISKKTVLINLNNCKIYYINYLNVINELFSKINHFENMQIIIMYKYYSWDIIIKTLLSLLA